MVKMLKLISIKNYEGFGVSRYTATFDNKGKIKIVHFGDSRFDNYTIHKDDDRKRLYLLRHFHNENWNNPITKGSLSRFILWNKPTLEESINDFKKRFSL